MPIAFDQEAGTTARLLGNLRVLVEHLIHIRPLADTAAATGLDAAEIVDLTAALGSWLAAVHGRSPVLTVGSADAPDQRPLFQAPPPPSGRKVKARLGKFEQRCADRRAARRYPVILPDGYDFEYSGRRLAGSIRAIVASQPTEDELRRFLASSAAARVHHLGR